MVQLLLRHGANASMKLPMSGSTPLIFAAAYPNMEVVRLLVAAGADVNAKDNDGHTAAVIAADRGTDEVARFLVAAGMKVEMKSILGLMLVRAARKGDLKK
jgi:ankyrin repeat protein